MEPSRLFVYSCYLDGKLICIIASQDAKMAITLFIEEFNQAPQIVVPLDNVYADGMPRILAR